MNPISHVAVIVTVVLQMALGFLWYAEWAFGTPWLEGVRLDPAAMGNPDPSVFLVAIAAAFAIGYGMRWLLGQLGWSGAGAGLRLGLFIGVVFVGLTLAVHGGFAMTGSTVQLIEFGKEAVTFAVVGLVLGAWPSKAAAAA